MKNKQNSGLNKMEITDNLIKNIKLQKSNNKIYVIFYFNLGQIY